MHCRLTHCTTSPDSGFTLLELLIVIAITGVLGALAFSAYTTYSVRTQVAEGISQAAAFKAAIADAFRADGQAPANHLAARIATISLEQVGPYVVEFEIVGGRIDINYGNDASRAIAGRRLSLTPYETLDLEIVWICGNHIPSLGLNPLGFAGGGNQAVQIPATIEARYSPAECR